MKTYCFAIKIVGKGNSKEEAWEDALDAARIEEYASDDVEVEWVEEDDEWVNEE